MAIAPLFVASKAALVGALRLTGAGGADQVALIDSGIVQARLKFYKCLGTTRVATLVAILTAENPTTNDGLLRALAEQTEILVVRRVLIETMPQLFMDASGGTLEQYNSEAAFRQGRPPQNALKAWDDEILKSMDVLKGSVAFGDAVGKLRTDNIEPTSGNEAPLPGASIWAGVDQGMIDRDQFPIEDGAGDL